MLRRHVRALSLYVIKFLCHRTDSPQGRSSNGHYHVLNQTKQTNKADQSVYCGTKDTQQHTCIYRWRHRTHTRRPRSQWIFPLHFFKSNRKPNLMSCGLPDILERPILPWASFSYRPGYPMSLNTLWTHIHCNLHFLQVIIHSFFPLLSWLSGFKKFNSVQVLLNIWFIKAYTANVQVVLLFSVLLRPVS